MGKRTRWLCASVPLLLLLQGVSSYITVLEESVCEQNSHSPALLNLAAKGDDSAAVLELRPRRRPVRCPLGVLAPPGHLLAVRLLPRNPPATSGRARRRRLEHCRLQVTTSHSRQPVWDLDLCNATSLERVLLTGTHMYTPAVALSWTISEDVADNLQVAGVLFTVVTRGSVACSKSGMVPCVTRGAFTLLCVSSELACDGNPNCPVGSFDEDEQLCGGGGGREDDHKEQDNSRLLSADSLAKALAHYGPWGYLMLGTLLCGALLMVCGLWECCCRGKRACRSRRRSPPSLQPLPPQQQPSVYVIAGPEAASAPPTYEELDQPPEYRALFPADKEQQQQQQQQQQQEPPAAAKNPSSTC